MIIRATIPQKVLSIILTGIVTLFISEAALSQTDTMNKEMNESSTEAPDADQPTSHSSPAVKPRELIDTDAKAAQLLMKVVEQDEVRTLNADGEQFMTLWQQDKTDNPFGAILILHGEGQSAEWPNTVSAIRNNLSQYGWNTLAISLPPPNKADIPKRPKAPTTMTKTTSETEPEEVSKEMTDKEKADAAATTQQNEAAMADLNKEVMMKMAPNQENMSKKKEIPDAEKRAEARLHASIQFLNEQGQYNIVIIGHGIGAIRAAKFIQKLSPQVSPDMPQAITANVPYKIRALVMVSARNRISHTEKGLISYLKGIPIPILDAYYGDHYLDSSEVSVRKRKIRTANTKNYYQVKVIHPNSSDTNASNRLTRRIRGFLNKHAKGVEIER